MTFKVVNIKWLNHESEKPEEESMCGGERITEFNGSYNKSQTAWNQLPHYQKARSL